MREMSLVEKMIYVIAWAALLFVGMAFIESIDNEPMIALPIIEFLFGRSH